MTTRGWRSGMPGALLAALFGVCAVLPAVEVPKDEPFRTWTSARGRTIEAKLIGLSEDKAQFRLKTGKSLVIKRDYLTTDDQEYLTHVGEPDTPAAPLSRQTLDMIVLRDVEFQDEPFEDVLGFIEQESKSPGLAPDGIRTGVHQDVDLNAIPGMTLRAEQLTLEQFLSAISDKTGLKYRLIKSTLVFTGADYAGELVTRTYRLREGALGLDDSTGNARDQVLRLLGDQGITFPRGADVKYEARSRKLVVTNTPENIGKTDRLLARMVVANARADMALSVYRLSERRAAALRGFMSIQPGFGGRVQADDEMALAVAAFRRGGVPSAMCRFRPSVVAGRRFAESKSGVSFSGVPLIHPGGRRMSLTFGLDIRSGERSVTASGTAELGVGQTIIVLAHTGLATAGGGTGGKPEYYVCEMALKDIAEK